VKRLEQISSSQLLSVGCRAANHIAIAFDSQQPCENASCASNTVPFSLAFG
jgi:hypothetical protein